MKKLYLIVGRTGSGKTTISNMLTSQYGLKQVKSYTTRPPRKGESSNPMCDHIFISDAEADKLLEKGNVAAYTQIGPYRYFVTKDMLKYNDLYVIDPTGVKSLKKNVGDDIQLVTVYISRDREEAIKSVCESRGQSAEDVKARIDAEDTQFTEFEKGQCWDILIDNNGKLISTVQELADFIKTA